MKQGGISWNGSHHNKPGVRTKSVCSICGRQYKMDWARNNHQKLCVEYNKSLERNVRR